MPEIDLDGSKEHNDVAKTSKKHVKSSAIIRNLVITEEVPVQ